MVYMYVCTIKIYKLDGFGINALSKTILIVIKPLICNFVYTQRIDVPLYLLDLHVQRMVSCISIIAHDGLTCKPIIMN